MKIELKYVTTTHSRHGTVFYYFRVSKGERSRLPGEPLSREFMEAYWAAIEHSVAPSADRQKLRLKPSALVLAPRAVSKQIRAAKAAGGAIYFVQGMVSHNIKIGFSTNVMSRLNGLTTGSSEKLNLLGAMSGSQADEQALHRKFSHLHVKGEWFKNDADLVNYIESVGADPAKSVIPNSWDDVT